MTSTQKPTVADLDRITKEYQDLKSLIDKYTARLNELKKQLSEAVDNFGHTDEKGNKWLPTGNYQLKRERRASVSFNSDDAESWAKDNGYWDDVVEYIETVNEDKVLALGWLSSELKSQIDALYTVRENFAFKIVEAKGTSSSGYYGDE